MKKFTYRWFFAPNAEGTEEQHTWLGGRRKKGRDPRVPDFEYMAQSLTNIIAELDERGYDVHTILPIQLGSKEPSITTRNEYLGDTSFTPTRGTIVIGKLRE